MAFDITTTAQTVQTAMEAMVDGSGNARFFAVDIMRPRSPLPQGPYAVIQPISARVAETTLTNTIEVHVLRVSLYLSPSARNDEEAVLLPARLASLVADLFVGDFTIGGSVRNVDVAGQYGEGMAVEFVERDEAETPYHVADITVPLIVDGATALVA